MSDLFWLSDEQMSRLEPFFPKPHGKPRVDDRRVLSGVIFINRNGLRWRDAPKEYGPHKTLYNRLKRWSNKGIFAEMLVGNLPKVEWRLGERGYDADWFREALKDKGIRAYIPGRKQRKSNIRYDKRRYKRRNMHRRWVATRYD